jgi:HAD superfamily hydrolase (TIGR01509 family)
MERRSGCGLRAVIFDVDGVLIDSEPFWRESEMEVFSRLGIALTESDCLLTVGMRIQEVVRYWRTRRPWRGAPPDAVAGEILRGVIDRVKTRGAPMPGLAGAIRLLEENGLRLALASSSAMTLIDAVVDRLEVRSHFTVICSAEDEPLGKPHPAVYLAAARRIGLPPEACAAVEDSINGVLSARAAGMRCIAVPLPELRGDPRFAQADAVLGSLAELDAGLLATIGGRIDSRSRECAVHPDETASSAPSGE